MTIDLVIRLTLFLGTAFVFTSPVESLIQRIRMRNRLQERRRREKGMTETERKLTELILLGFGSEAELNVFCILDGVLLFGTFLFALRTVRFGVAVFAGAAIGALPWCLLFLRAENRRRSASREGVTLLSELLRNYRTRDRNILSALEETVTVRELPITGKLLYRLLLQVRNAKDGESIRKASDDLAFALGTSWGNMLAYNLSYAIRSGRNIEGALEDLLVQLRDAEKLSEERKRINSETARIVNVFIPVLFPASLLMMHGSMELSWGKIFHNQFGTSEGLLLFLVIVILWVLNILFLNLVTGRKFDF